MTTIPLRHAAHVWVSNVDKLSTEGEIPVQLCNYVDVYKNDLIRPSDSLMRATARIDEVHRFHLEVGDTLLTKDSEDPTDIGISAHVAETADNLVCGYHLAIARPRAGTHPRYLTWATRTRPVLDHFTNNSSGISRYGLSTSGLMATPIPMPALDEQRRIADFLDDRVARIDQIIAARRQQARATEQAFASIRRGAALAGASHRTRLDLPWASNVPSHWPVRRLRQLATMGTGHTPSRANEDYWADCHIPWLTTADVHKFRHDEVDSLANTQFTISQLGLENSAAVLHPAGTVALSRTASAGFSILMETDMATSQDYVTWTCGPDLLPQYLLQLLRVMRPYLLGFLAMGSTHKTIYFPDLMDLRVPLPPLSEQQAAVERIRAAHESRIQVVRRLEHQVTLLQEYKQSLITAAVTGEFDVTTASTKIPE